jgi:hypothetical protein
MDTPHDTEASSSLHPLFAQLEFGTNPPDQEALSEQYAEFVKQAP